MSGRIKTLLLLVGDLLVMYMVLTAVICFRKGLHPNLPTFLVKNYNFFVYVFSLWSFVLFVEGLYTLKSYNSEKLAISVMRATCGALIVSFIGIYLFKISNLTPKTNLVLVALFACPLLYFWRRIFFKLISRDQRLIKTFIVGSSATISLVKNEIFGKPHLGYKIIGTHSLENLQLLSIDPSVELIAIERTFSMDRPVYKKVFSFLGSSIEVIDLAKFIEQISGKIPINAIDESWFIEHCGHQESRSYDLLKIFLDRIVAIALLAMLIPFAMILLPILFIVHGRPLFFKQTRTGINNKPFELYKLRTMCVDAEHNGAQWAIPSDPRVTPMGKFLRKTRLDELPQLFNIIRGDMSLVGPRPERPEIIETLLAPNIPYYDLRHLVKPGVTGWAQTRFRYGFSAEDSLEKLQYDLYYVKNKSIWLDLLIFLKTIKTILTGAGQ